VPVMINSPLAGTVGFITLWRIAAVKNERPRW
jgi:hypothetical protein